MRRAGQALDEPVYRRETDQDQERLVSKPEIGEFVTMRMEGFLVDRPNL